MEGDQIWRDGGSSETNLSRALAKTRFYIEVPIRAWEKIRELN